MSDCFATPWIVACQAPLSTGFHRQEYWSRLPFPSLENLPNLGMKPHFLNLLHWQADSLPLRYVRSPRTMILFVKKKKKREGSGGESPCNPSGPRLTDDLQFKVSMIGLELISFSVHEKGKQKMEELMQETFSILSSQWWMWLLPSL